MKASALSEDFGKPKLEERLGDYRPPEAFQDEKTKSSVAFSDALREKKEVLLAARNKATSWQELHQAFKTHHLKLVILSCRLYFLATKKSQNTTRFFLTKRSGNPTIGALLMLS